MATPAVSIEKDPELLKSPAAPSSEISASDDQVVTEDYGSQNDHVFTDPTTAEYWENIYRKAKYESLHRFDPNVKWTAAEEKKLLRKIDWRIMLWTWIMFIALDLNRRNINRAITDNLLEELGMNTNNFNYGQTVLCTRGTCSAEAVAYGS